MSARYVSIDEMTPVLEWLASQRPEAVHAHFSMFRVAFESPQVLGSSFGASDAMRRLNQFGNMLATTVRRTDLVARDLTDFWVIAPECNVDMVGCRLCEIANSVTDFGLDIVDCSVGVYLFPIRDVDFAGMGGRKVLQRLRTITPHFSFDPARDCAVTWIMRTGKTLDDWKGQIQSNCFRLRSLCASPNPS